MNSADSGPRELDRKLQAALERGDLTEEDADHVEAFAAFLNVIDDRRAEGGRAHVPAEWMPYALGEGPPPPSPDPGPSGGREYLDTDGAS